MRLVLAAFRQALLVAFTGLLTWPLSSYGAGVGDILNRVAITPPARVLFREERHNSMLQEPLVLNGYLEYLAPGLMKKVIETPFREVITVSEKAVEIERDGQTQKLSLRRSRSLQAMLSGVEAVIAGDESQLLDAFELELQESPDGWSIRLTPKSRRVARNLEDMYVTGRGDVIEGIRIELGDGEWHQIELQQDRSGS